MDHEDGSQYFNNSRSSIPYHEVAHLELDNSLHSSIRLLMSTIQATSQDPDDQNTDHLANEIIRIIPRHEVNDLISKMRELLDTRQPTYTNPTSSFTQPTYTYPLHTYHSQPTCGQTADGLLPNSGPTTAGLPTHGLPMDGTRPTHGPAMDGSHPIIHSHHHIPGSAMDGHNFCNPSPMATYFPTLPAPPTSHIPRLRCFSGDGTDNNTVTFPQWKQDVENLIQRGWPESSIIEAISRSLKGTAYNVFSLMSTPNTGSVLKEFAIKFGSPVDLGTLLERFHTAKQKQEEPVVSWSTRLDQMASELQKLNIHQDQSLVRNKFWTGLKDERVKCATRHKYDSPISYTDLILAVRAAESEMCGYVPPQPQSTSHKQMYATNNSDLIKTINDLKKQVQSYAAELNQVKGMLQRAQAPPSNTSQQQQTPNAWSQPQGHPQGQPQRYSHVPTASTQGQKFCTFCHRIGHTFEECRTKQRFCTRCNKYGHLTKDCCAAVQGNC